MAIINGIGRVGIRSIAAPASTPTYPSSLKLFIDAGNPLSYPGTGTSVLDLTTNHNNGTLINGVGYTSSNNGALVFDGVNDYVNLGTNLFNYTDISISYWVYGGVDGSQFQNFNFDPLGYYFGFQTLNLAGHQYIVFYGGTSGSGQTSLYSPTVLNSNQYYRITFTKQTDGNIKLYINGVLDTTKTTTINPSYHPTFNYSVIGAQYYFTSAPSLSYLINGKLAGLKVSNSVWTASEALADFNEFKTRYGYVS